MEPVPADSNVYGISPSNLIKNINYFLSEISSVGDPMERLLQIEDLINRLVYVKKNIEMIEHPIIIMLLTDAIKFVEKVLNQQGQIIYGEMRMSSSQVGITYRLNTAVGETVWSFQPCPSSPYMAYVNGRPDIGLGAQGHPVSTHGAMNFSEEAAPEPRPLPSQQQSNGQQKRKFGHCMEQLDDPQGVANPERITQMTLDSGLTYDEVKSDMQAVERTSWPCSSFLGMANENEHMEIGLLDLNQEPGSGGTSVNLVSPFQLDLNLPPVSEPSTLLPQQKLSARKKRKLWSSEQHQQFVFCVEQLGGPQAATPTKIKELMQDPGLSCDEVKSHLQKYRLNTKKDARNDFGSSSSTSSANMSQ